jgi:dTDP-4-amino-4,6-dideoxygalactose transaminase
VRSERRAALAADLASVGIGTGVHYPLPDHQQPVLAGIDFGRAELTVTEQACREVLSLPCFPELRDEEIDHVVASLVRFA